MFASATHLRLHWIQEQLEFKFRHTSEFERRLRSLNT